MKYIRILCAISAMLWFAPPLMAKPQTNRVFTPAENSADFLSVAALHKNSQDAASNIEPYTVALILMAHTRTVSLAYVDARGTDDLVVFEEVLMRKPGGAWQSIWAWGINGANECAQGIAHYDKIIRYVKRRGVNSRKLLPGFEQKVKDARKGIECEFGDFESNDAVLKE